MLTQIINARILTPQGWLKDGSVLIRDNKILEVTNCDLAIIGAKLIDAKGMYIVLSLREIFIKRDSPHGRKRTPNVLIVPDDVINVEQMFMGPIK